MSLSLSANLTLMYTEFPMLERFRAAARDGFAGCEMLFPYAWSIEALGEALSDSGLPLVLHNLPPGDWEAGERGIACLPGREAEFREGVDRAIEYATALDCPALNCLAGLRPVSLAREDALNILCENLAYALPKMEAAGLCLNLEAINSRVDMPGFLLDSGEQVLSLMAELAHPALGFQYDIYHMAVMGGDVVQQLQAWGPQIRHVQFADTPGRHEPGSGSLDWPRIFSALAQCAYSGWVSAEYRPAQTETANTLSWVRGFHEAIVQ